MYPTIYFENVSIKKPQVFQKQKKVITTKCVKFWIPNNSTPFISTNENVKIYFVIPVTCSLGKFSCFFMWKHHPDIQEIFIKVYSGKLVCVSAGSTQYLFPL